MLNRIFFISILFINSLLLTQCSEPSSSSQGCEPGFPWSTDYMRRDENRCEGIKKNTDVSGGIELISLTTSAITKYDKELQLHIPKFSNDLRVVSSPKGYRLDKIKRESFKGEASVLTFSWSTYVLTNENIEPESLRTLASYKDGSHDVFLPVTLGESSSGYKFVIYSGSTVENSTFEISGNGKFFRRICRSTIPKRGEIICEWKANKAPKGRYQLKYKFKLKESKEDSITFKFEHNPAWLQ